MAAGGQCGTDWELTIYLSCSGGIICVLDINQAPKHRATNLCAISHLLHNYQRSSCCRSRLKPDGTRWRTCDEVKGKQAIGVGSQYSSTLPRNVVYPALLPTIKTCDQLPSNMASRELSSKIKQFQHHRLNITLVLMLTQWVQLFPVLYDRYICQLQLGCHPVAVVQYTFTHKQYTEKHE